MSNMNDLQSLMLVMWPLMALSGIFIYKAFLAITGAIADRRRRKEYASLNNATKDTICKGPHTWNTIKLAMAGLPTDQYMVCSDCGFVSTDLGFVQLNKPALEIYRNELRLREQRKTTSEWMKQRKQEELDRIMNIMVQHHYTDRLDVELLQQFFRKTVIEIDSLYDRLLDELEEKEKRG